MKTPKEKIEEMEKENWERICSRCGFRRNVEAFPVGENESICIYCINESETK